MKYYKFIDGIKYVGVLYTPEIGQGWSTNNDTELSEELLFNSVLIELVLHNQTSVITENFLNLLLNNLNYFDVRSVPYLKVHWIPKNSKFKIDRVGIPSKEVITILKKENYYVA